MEVSKCGSRGSFYNFQRGGAEFAEERGGFDLFSLRFSPPDPPDQVVRAGRMAGWCGLGVSALRTITNKIWISLNGYKFGELDQS
ncbi:hypothetical protein D4R75_12110 [bacterium]|nr:MAG: hypothetical protein D4R75_12110 [bacterium]